jgi:hypothetical protein
MRLWRIPLFTDLHILNYVIKRLRS